MVIVKYRMSILNANSSTAMKKAFLFVALGGYLHVSANAQMNLFRTRIPKAITDTSSTYPILGGVWKSIGNGYFLDALTPKIILYSYTKMHCYRETNEFLSNLLNTSSLYSLNVTNDTLSIYLHDFGKNTTRLQSKMVFVRLPNLPPNCSSLTEKQRENPEFLFDLFWTTLKENYAFALERNVDWERIYTTYKPRISAQIAKDELFDIMGEIVTFTKDQHTKIIDSDGKVRQYSGVPSALVLRETFDQQTQVKDFNQYAKQFFETNYKDISDDLLKGKGKKVANQKLEWGELDDDIGYVHIHGLAGFAPSELPRKQHIDTLNFYMTQLMRTFESKKAIILDVSFNFGGYDAAGLTIASYFTNQPQPAYTKYTFQEGMFHQGSNIQVYPAQGYGFNKPVYVMTTDISRSAAESFVMQMKALPNVTVVGTNTLGILSDMLGKSIGAYYLTISNEKYLTPDGKMYEVKGVDVDLKMEVFPKQNMFHGHRDAVREMMDLIHKKIATETDKK